MGKDIFQYVGTIHSLRENEKEKNRGMVLSLLIFSSGRGVL